MMTAKMGEKDSRDDILKAFRVFDTDESGAIDLKKLDRVAKDLGENMTDEELAELIQEVDRSGEGTAITEADFMRVMRKCGLC